MPDDMHEDPAAGPRCLRNAFWIGVLFWAVLIALVALTGCGDHRAAATGARNIVEAADALDRGADPAAVAAAIRATAQAMARQLDPRGEVAASVPAAAWVMDSVAASAATQTAVTAIDEETGRQQWWRSVRGGAWSLVQAWWPAGAGVGVGAVAWWLRNRGKAKALLAAAKTITGQQRDGEQA